MLLLCPSGLSRIKSTALPVVLSVFDFFFSPEKGPSKYILTESVMTWHKARTYCTSHHTDLASVRNTSENSVIKSLLSTKTWIGLHRKPWSYWSDQTPVTYTNWHPDEPINHNSKESCAIVNPRSAKWINRKCNYKGRHFVCESVFHPKNRTMFKLRFRSEAELNDPDVQHQILKQVPPKHDTQFPHFLFCFSIAS
uniref:C-type lectin domain-containing protein n=1 Tax=Stegastes partitus TaxID=144197 RepID=A0A3B4ZS57_9TELE